MNPADRLAQLLSQSLEGVIGDLVEARALVHEGVSSLTASFHGFREQIHAQTEQLHAVARLLEGSESEEGFIKQMDGVVSRFVDDLVQVAASSVKLVSRVDEMGSDLEQVFRHVDRIEGLASETRFIALNARIEAHRVGEVGRTFRVVADEVKSLADDATTFSAQIRELVQRTRARLGEARTAVGKLASHDMNGALEAQSQVLKALATLDATNGRVRLALGNVEQHISDAVRALQFEDMVSQLVEASTRRLGAVRELWLEWLARRPLLDERAIALLDVLAPPPADSPSPPAQEQRP